MDIGPRIPGKPLDATGSKRWRVTASLVAGVAALAVQVSACQKSKPVSITYSTTGQPMSPPAPSAAQASHHGEAQELTPWCEKWAKDMKGVAAAGQRSGSARDSAVKPSVVTKTRVSRGKVTGADRVVNRMRGGFSRCYAKGLRGKPGMAGGVCATVQIGPDGDVIGVSPAPMGRIEQGVANCIASRIRIARFDPPNEGQATIDIFVSLNSVAVKSPSPSPSP